MREWPDYDKDGAIEWALSMSGQGGKEIDEKMGALPTVASWWAEKDPVAASDWAMKLPEGKNKDQLLNNVSIIPWIIG